MAGQPEPGSNTWITFDVTDMQVIESGAIAPSAIVPINGPFDLSVTFDGLGPIWDWVEREAVTFHINFYAEGLGVNAEDVDLGNKDKETSDDGGPYTVTLENVSIPIAGLYKLACTVTSSSPVAGFFEGLTLQVIEES